MPQLTTVGDTPGDSGVVGQPASTPTSAPTSAARTPATATRTAAPRVVSVRAGSFQLQLPVPAVATLQEGGTVVDPGPLPATEAVVSGDPPAPRIVVPALAREAPAVRADGEVASSGDVPWALGLRAFGFVLAAALLGWGAKRIYGDYLAR